MKFRTRGDIALRLCITLLLVVLIAAALTGCAKDTAPAYQNISPGELAGIIREEQNYYLVDVREPEELLATGFISGAVNIPVGKIKQDFGSLPQTGKLVIYCRSGRRSADVAEFLSSKGFDNVYNLTGGINAWPYDKEQPAKEKN